MAQRNFKPVIHEKGKLQKEKKEDFSESLTRLTVCSLRFIHRNFFALVMHGWLLF